MKKWMAMALALCMLCSMVNVTYAEASKFQTISTSVVDFDVPANAEYEIYDHGSNVSIFVFYDQWDINIQFNTGASGSEYQQQAFDESSGGYCVANYGWIPLKDADWGLADGGVVKSCHTVEGSPYLGTTNIFTHAFDWGFMELHISRWGSSEAIDEADLIDVVKPIFRSVRMPGSASTKDNTEEMETAPVGKQPLTIGRASFEVDADLEIVQMRDYQWMLMKDQYAVVFTYDDWENDDIDFTNGDMQIDACYILYYLGSGDQQTAERVCNLVQRKDIGMPGGDDVLHLSLGGVVMLSHYYPNMGFMMMGQCKDGSLSDEKILAMLEEIALSFRVDGMTADEMAAHKAQAEAELEAAQAAAEEAATTQQYVVITNSSANIRAGSNGSAAKITSAKQGDSFPYLGEENGWYKIDVNGQIGYVSKSLSELK